MKQDDCNPFAAFDNLVIDNIASFLSLHSTYRLVCACQAYLGFRKSDDVLTPEWFIRRTFQSIDDLELLPLDQESNEKFFLAETFPQMIKCRLIPKFCISSNSCGNGQYLADMLDVSPDSVYTQWMAMFLARLWYLAQRHAKGRSQNNTYTYPQVLLWDFLHAARIMGFCGIPQHDRVFHLHCHLYETIVYATTIELCSIVDPDAASRIEEMALTDIRRLLQQVIESLLVESNDDDAYQRIYSYLRIPNPRAMLDDCDSDEESWYKEEVMEDLSFHGEERISFVGNSDLHVSNHLNDSTGQQFDVLSDIVIEYEQIMEDLHEIYEDITNYSLQDFGVQQTSSRLSSSSQCPPPTLLSRSLHQMGLPQQQKCTNSAIKFVQSLLEGIHFGSAIEVKVRKKSMPDMIFDYGIIFDQNGTVWRGSVLSSDEPDNHGNDDESLLYAMEQTSDEEYIPSDDDTIE
jgi:hypothetical protein